VQFGRQTEKRTFVCLANSRTHDASLYTTIDNFQCGFVCLPNCPLHGAPANPPTICSSQRLRLFANCPRHGAPLHAAHHLQFPARWWAVWRGAPWRGQFGRQTEPRWMGTTDGRRVGGEGRGVGNLVGRRSRAGWELQMVGGVEGSAVGLAVR
jgi:hypothetical protein